MAERVTRKDALVYGGAAVGGVVAGGAAVAAVATSVERNKAGQPVEGEPIVAPFVEGDLPVTDPGADAWGDAQAVLVPLVAQQLVQPYLDEAGVGELEVRALHDGSSVALLLGWPDDSVDDLDGIRRYHDAVAVQLPTKEGAAPALTMGAPGFPVHILQWRATWQRDIDSGGNTGVDQIYPEVIHDVMPDDVLPPETAQLYWVGREAGNPLSQVDRSTPVEEAVAEGFGSVTHLSRQTAVGRGVHDGGRWRVAIGVPAARTGVGTPLAPGTSWPIAFAVWLGSEENRGGRKHIANWQTLVLEARA
jgi:complex iron-sulfur molybdoenzyme family reductase subunit gamma